MFSNNEFRNLFVNRVNGKYPNNIISDIGVSNSLTSYAGGVYIPAETDFLQSFSLTGVNTPSMLLAYLDWNNGLSGEIASKVVLRSLTFDCPAPLDFNLSLTLFTNFANMVATTYGAKMQVGDQYQAGDDSASIKQWKIGVDGGVNYLTTPEPSDIVIEKHFDAGQHTIDFNKYVGVTNYANNCIALNFFLDTAANDVIKINAEWSNYIANDANPGHILID